jgi:hypothetical protein
MKSAIAVLVFIVILAIVAVIVSKGARTSSVITSLGDFFAKVFKTATAPVSQTGV